MKRIKPLIPERVVTPQCSVPFDPARFQEHYLKRRQARGKSSGYVVERCTRPSSYVIDGKHYCTMHAGQVALRLLGQP
jgi:hypothetical protein